MTQPNTRHQHDDQLLPPLRWLTRAMGSWWLVACLGLIVGLYLLATFVPLGQRFLWQQHWFDSTQTQVMRWVPIHIAMLLLAVSVVWVTLRGVPWRLDNVGAFVAALGFAVAVFGLSLSMRFGVHGVIMVPRSDEGGMALTTNYADPVGRVLVVQYGPNPPLSIPLDPLPRWNDVPPSADGLGPLSLQLHTHTDLSRQLDYRVRLTVVGYLAAGEVSVDTAGQSTVRPGYGRIEQADGRLLPDRAVIALRIESEDERGRTESSLVWLPFEPTGAERLMPTQRYDVPGFGSLGLAFRPVAHDLPFALGVSVPPSKTGIATMHLAENNPSTNRMMPMLNKTGLKIGESWTHDPLAAAPEMRRVKLELVSLADSADQTLAKVRVSTAPGRLTLRVGAWVTLGGLVCWGACHFVLSREAGSPT
ncbi:MAG: hypothetical protein AAGC44_04580 [Planctomycetota bacterium]